MWGPMLEFSAMQDRWTNTTDDTDSYVNHMDQKD